MDNIIKFNPADEAIKLFYALPEKIYGRTPKERVLPDASCYLVMRNGTPCARLSLRMFDTESAAIGHYEALDASSGVMLLKHALVEAKNRGAKNVIGPIDGSTWEKYRLAPPLEKGDPRHHPDHFTGEPQNPLEYAGHFSDAGFVPLDSYESRITDDLLCNQSKTISWKRKNRTVRDSKLFPLNMKNYDDGLFAIYTLSVEAFAKNRFYKPIDFDRFKMLYAAIKDFLDPELVWLASDDTKKLAGFAFAYADLAGMEKGKRPTRLVFKTLAVSEAQRGL